MRPPDKRRGPDANPGPDHNTATNGTHSIADGRGRVVVDLAEARARRVAQTAGGCWWGGWELHTWAQAEASRWRWPA